MRRVLKEADRVAQNPDPDAVHDLRVALRRSRTMAAGMAQLDPKIDARPVRKLARRLFRRLGKLRDVQVMKEWLTKLSAEDDVNRASLFTRLSARDKKLQEKVLRAIRTFDVKGWKEIAGRLARRAGHIALDGPDAQRLAAARLAEAGRLHRRALRTPSAKNWHALRIGLKRFRYVVENFLPARSARWGEDLKGLQDLLGEVHDLDVLAEKLAASDSLDTSRLQEWTQRIDREQTIRLAEYRRKMTGRNSLWRVWRGALSVARPEMSGQSSSTTQPRRGVVLGSQAKAGHPAAA